MEEKKSEDLEKIKQEIEKIEKDVYKNIKSEMEELADLAKKAEEKRIDELIKSAKDEQEKRILEKIKEIKKIKVKTGEEEIKKKKMENRLWEILDVIQRIKGEKEKINDRIGIEDILPILFIVGIGLAIIILFRSWEKIKEVCNP